MKLLRFGEPGKEKTGVLLEDGRQVDTSPFGEDYGETFFKTNGLERLSRWIQENKNSLHEIPKGSRIGPPIQRPSKIICIGLNFKDHAQEAGADIPDQPVVFFKASSAVVGPNDNLELPKNSSKVDWEVELAIVIGKHAKYISQENAIDYIAGYCLHNDYSERAFQLEQGGQWVKGKSCDTFAPLGPYLVTKDEVPNPNNLAMWLSLNGKKMQGGNTENFIFTVEYLVSYLSQYMSLLPGDIISTGTPAGVGFGFDPPIFLKEGDVVELGIQNLGESRQTVVST